MRAKVLSKVRHRDHSDPKTFLPHSSPSTPPPHPQTRMSAERLPTAPSGLAPVSREECQIKSPPDAKAPEGELSINVNVDVLSRLAALCYWWEGRGKEAPHARLIIT